MNITVHADNADLRMEVDIEQDGEKASALIHRQGGQWMITRPRGTTWLGNSRIQYPEALKRALIALQKDIAP